MFQGAVRQSMGRWCLRRAPLVALGLPLTLGALPATALAHGPIAPVASAYFAKPLQVPPGLTVKVVDGDLRMWLRAPAGRTVVVLDYQGAPYLRFARDVVAVNHNSAMYYLNQTPFAQTPPANLTARTPPSWHPASSGRAYEWHDGRLHALASVALRPGVSFVGRWNIPLRVDGRLESIDGGLWHADDPPLVWLWVIAVLIACVLAAWRLRRRQLDVLLGRVLAAVALAGVVLAGLGVQLHGRPSISVFQAIELACILAFAAWAFWRAVVRPPGFFMCFLVSVAAIWAGGVLIPTLFNGFVLIALPGFLARAVAVTCLGAGAALLLLVFRLADYADWRAGRAERARTVEIEPGATTESMV